jgi:dihydroflavonol-4-reductase
VTTLITGASGFVGSAVLRSILANGHRTRVLVRKSSPRNNLEGLDVEIFVGDLTNPASLKSSLAGCKALFHVAADYRLWSPDPAELYRTNVDGTRNLLMLAAEAGIERIVYTSSVATLGLNADGTPATEATPVSITDMIGDYKRSKFLAEEAVLRLVAEQQLPVVIVNPSTPIGPRDIKPTPTGKIIVDAVSGRMPAYVDTGLNLVHVDDVARGHLLAFTQGRIGERYILGGDNLSLKNILEQIAEISGTTAPKIRLPHHLVLPLAYGCELWARLRGGGEPRVTVDGVRMSMKCMYFSSTKAQRELGYTIQPAATAIRAAIDWFRANGYCPN